MGLRHTPIILPTLAAAPAAPPAGVSSLYARSDGRIYHQAGSGSAQPLLGVSARLTADQVKTGTTASNITGLQIPVQPGTYYLRYLLGYTADTSGAIRLGLNGPTASAAQITVDVYTTADTPPTPHRLDVIAALDTLSTAATGVTTGVALAAIMTARVVFSTAGNVTVRWAASAAASQVTLKAGSYGVCWAAQ
ncbi:hypothetical protein [Streptosporangium sp. NPDC051022]|uniref:hypothetical protein n=1 Tax=Streptosporangium sp. NPDC051022 TaxID=3155752 RepID=UPI003438CC9E